ncbi:hypothetical protein HYV80_06025 [Candidatus Woesearchaeota archaeon]|nr:hypothetical protein [Candidatus Woesearchaeota archaeon]
MKKVMLLIFALLLISIAACNQAAQEPVIDKADSMEKVPAATGDAAVDAVGNDLNNVDGVDQDLSDDELSELDSGFDDVQNI